MNLKVSCLKIKKQDEGSISAWGGGGDTLCGVSLGVLAKEKSLIVS